MKRLTVRKKVLFLFLPITFFLVSVCFVNADTDGFIKKMTQIKVVEKSVPPTWALKQQRLFDAIEETAPLFIAKYSNRGGTLKEHGKLDDDYECFNTWPLFYAMGGSENILNLSLEHWSGITRQWTYQYKKTVKDEFVKQYDMLHLSEGYVGLQYFGLADPKISENIERARRFSAYYTGDDEYVKNYDSSYRVMLSPITGSSGPAKENSPDYILIWGHASLYPVIRDLEKGWEKDKIRYAEIKKIFNDVVISGDVPMNLAITGLITHTYILTGDEKYKKWVLDYVDAWIERTKANGGIIPDNVGVHGITGEKRRGQWWGGFFGWTGRYSVEMIFNSLITASECAYMLSGDPKYPDFLRSQINMLLSKSIIREGNLLVPYKVGPNGWYDYRPLGPYIAGHLWHCTLDPIDWNIIEKLKAGRKNEPHEYYYAESPDPPLPGQEEWKPFSSLFDWNRVLNDVTGNKHRQNEPPHLGYLGGTNPAWPESILDAEYEQVCRAADRLKGNSYRHEWASQTLLSQNPVFTNGIAQMTMGAPFTCFNGGLVIAQVRYFDLEKKRPGLPRGVSALVEKMDKDKVVVVLFNTNILESQKIIIQSGAYAEHQINEIKYYTGNYNESIRAADTFRKVNIDSSFFEVDMEPSTYIRLEIKMKRFVNKPTYLFPWDRN